MRPGRLSDSIFTAEGLARLYGRRQKVNPTEGRRRPATVALTLGLALVLLAALASLMWVYRDEAAFLDAQSGVVRLGPDDLIWNVAATDPVPCPVPDAAGCLPAAHRPHQVYDGRDLRAVALAPLLARTDGQAVTFLVLTTRIPYELYAKAAADGAMALSLPPLRYELATVAVGGRPAGVFAGGERLSVRFFHDHRRPVALEVTVELAVRAIQPLLVGGERDATQVVVAEAGRFQRYLDHLAALRSGRGKQLADIARIVLAIFGLILFLLVDGSPESLGLALFMGFKAAGVVLAQNWFPEGWLPGATSDWLRGWCLCFGDVIQLYFFTQLARIVHPTLKPWFLYGGLAAAAYATLTSLNLGLGGVNWTAELWRARNVSLGLACLAVAVTSGVYLARRGLYYRAAALALAAAGAVVQVAYPLLVAVTSVGEASWFQTAYHALETFTPYLFALSAFLNLRTLEHRVKVLSKELVSAREIEREMALGRTVQQSFLRIPKVPAELGLVCVHEAAVYVSGDIYFVHWDEAREMLTLLINDVTGHGVQAALKASVCSTIADSIWGEHLIREDDALASRFKTYDHRLHACLARMGNAPDMVALIGGEYDRRRGQLSLYRVNGLFPLLVEPTAEGGDGSGKGPYWSVRVVPLRNREVATIPLPRGGFALLLSDGFIDTSRRLAELYRHLTRQLAGRGAELNAETLKDLVLLFERFADTGDDRTLLVFQGEDREAAAGRRAA